MAASTSVVSVAAAAAAVPGVSPGADFSDLREIKKQLLLIAGLTRERGLLHSSKWSAELAFSLPALPLSELQPPPPLTEEDAQDVDAYTLAKAYFDVKEYDRAAHFLHGCNSKKAYFLYMYSRYLSGEKKKDDETVDSLGPLEKGQVKNEALRELRVELSRKHQARGLDGFGLYLYGVVLRKLDLVKEAIDVFVEATHVLPLHWGAWLELCNLITDKEMLKFLSLPDTWMKEFFLAHIYTELQLIEEALQKYQHLIDVGFSKSSYIVSQIAVAYHNIRDIDKALSIFNELRKQDPYRIENMDTFSNLLYVRSMKSELSYLAHNLCEIDKYRVETCCVIGNYYSLRSQHEKAALYFQRALKLNPRYLGAWTLMGHEYMEMKNTSAAIQAYRLHEQLTESEQAAQCYIKYIQDIYSCGEVVEHLEESTAFRYLAQYYFKCKLWDEASTCAQKCCAFNDVSIGF
ncbi:Cell division cycle protein 23-like protein [Microtus ochrogaster]|uniref:Cell division cycle protein 23-like protein n=1 Tax=Microtus ochrogaster TaxID=79684 RepID=A0A8J6G8M1_MICOH|nr:Cell division cycle protein 23-like protein [Microtus ochrogaster]